MTSFFKVSVVVEVRFNGRKRAVGAGADWSANGFGMLKKYSDGGPTDHELQRRGSLSQSTTASLGLLGFAARIAAVC